MFSSEIYSIYCMTRLAHCMLGKNFSRCHFEIFLDGFLKLSFKIAMSGWASGGWAVVGRRPRFTFWLTFFQSYMLPLFFNGLLSYLVGMKRRTSRCFTCKRDNSYSLHYLKKQIHNAVRRFSCSYLENRI